MSYEQRLERLEGQAFCTALRLTFLLLLASRLCLAQDDPQQELERAHKELQEVRKERDALRQALEQASKDFFEYKAAKDAELAEQTQRATAALARARTAETALRELRARLDKRQATVELRAARERFATLLRTQDTGIPAVNQRLATRALVRFFLPNSIKIYQRQFKRQPPMSAEELNRISRFKRIRLDTNSLNECNEALLVALANPDFSAPLRARDLPTQQPFGNTDTDRWVKDGGWGVEAREILDAWGHPVVYIHRNHYPHAVRIVNGAGVEVKVVALIGPHNVYYNPTSYQIISLGPNGVQETKPKDLKDSDDIRNFELRSK